MIQAISHIRNRLIPKSGYLLKTSFNFSSLHPSSKSSIVLSNLSSSITQANLLQKLETLKCKKLQLEPGITCHFKSYLDAFQFESKVAEKFPAVQTRTIETSLPSITVDHLPHHITPEVLQVAFQPSNPIDVKINGLNSFQMVLSDLEATTKIRDSIKKTMIGGKHLMVESTTESKQKFRLSIYNFQSKDKDAVNDVITSTLHSLQIVPDVSPQYIPRQPSSIMLRYNPLTESQLATVQQDIATNLTTAGGWNKELKVVSLSKCSIVVRNLDNISDEMIKELFDSYEGSYHTQFIRQSKDTKINSAFIFFENERSALMALSKLKATPLKDRSVNASFRYNALPVVSITGLPANAMKRDVQGLIEPFEMDAVIHSGKPGQESKLFDTLALVDPTFARNEKESISQFLVVLSSPSVADAVVQSLHGRKVGKDDSVLSVSRHDLKDIGIKVSATDEENADISMLAAALTVEAMSAQPIGMLHESNTSATIAFSKLSDATKSMGHWQKHQMMFAFHTDGKGPNSALEATRSSTTTTEGGGSSEVVRVDHVNIASVTVTPSCAVQLNGVEVDCSVNQLMETLSKDLEPTGSNLASNIVKIDRSALLRFRRSREVVPALKKLKALIKEDQELVGAMVEKYERIQPNGSSPYDIEDGPDESFDKSTLTSVLKDFMEADPADRYKIARNQFEIELVTALAQKNSKYLLGSETSYNDSIQKEVTKLLSKAMSSHKSKKYNTRDDEFQPKSPLPTLSQIDSKISDRLFEIFLQREDMLQFSFDFNELESFTRISPAPLNTDESVSEIERAKKALYDFKTFSMDSDKDIARILAKSEEIDAMHRKNMIEELKLKNVYESEVIDNEVTQKPDTSALMELTPSEFDESTLSNRQKKKIAKLKQFGRSAMLGSVQSTATGAGSGGGEGEKKPRPKLNARRLRDSQGNQWSGVIINRDSVQKVMPGIRVRSKRVLVVIGNLKGTGGYGVGKGRKFRQALQSAFRAALKNLIHIDLYDNFGLAHNLYGKHNSCHAYIQALPINRVGQSGRVANAIMSRFGIGRASVKLEGRRHPYSQVMAIFNALRGHENIDEYAKDRGLRYLTLRWAHEQKV